MPTTARVIRGDRDAAHVPTCAAMARLAIPGASAGRGSDGIGRLRAQRSDGLRHPAAAIGGAHPDPADSADITPLMASPAVTGGANLHLVGDRAGVAAIGDGDGTETVPSDPGVAPTYRAVQELRFTAHEYLKGSGPTALLVVVRSPHAYLTEAKARADAEFFGRLRVTTWDDRQGVLFLEVASAAVHPGRRERRGDGRHGPRVRDRVAFHAIEL